MEEENTSDKVVDDNPKSSLNTSILSENKDNSHLNFTSSKDSLENSISSKENLESLVSTESILSSINEECIKISSKEKEKEKENGMKCDSESSLDMIDKVNSLCSSSEDKERELKETSENGQSSLSSEDQDQADSNESLRNASSSLDNLKTTVDSSQNTSVLDDKLRTIKNNDEMETDTNEDDIQETIPPESDLLMDTDSVLENLTSVPDELIEDSVNDLMVVQDDSFMENTNDSIKENTNDSIKENTNDSLKENTNEIVVENEVVENDTSKTDASKTDMLAEKDINTIDKLSEDDLKSSDIQKTGKIKIKLRSFASLCEDDKDDDDICNSIDINSSSNFEVSGVAVGDIVQHGNIVELDESGVMHLKISNVVGGEDCITGLSMEEGGDTLHPIQISSITSLIEPLSPDDVRIEKIMSSNSVQSGINSIQIAEVESMAGKETESDTSNNKEALTNNQSTDNKNALEIIVNIFRSPLIVASTCVQCKKKLVCEFRMVCRQHSENKVSFICSSKCKTNAISNLPETQIVQKPRLYFERVCGMCGKDISPVPKRYILSWQTREFCNKLCLADHIGEVGRTCFYCKSNVRVLYMVKYCVRFGSDVHQFCCNTCLETYKTTIKVCSFCQKNLNCINKVISPSNKEYCSNKCLKRAQRRDIGQINYKEENECTVCLKKMINIYEFIHNSAPTFLCSNPCLNVFKYVNQVKSVNCCLCARLLNAEDTSNYFFNGKQLRVFCSESCFSVFVISARKIVTCYYCKVKKYNFDMISATALSEETGEVFCCSVCCLNFVESQQSRNSAPDSVTQTEESLSKSQLLAIDAPASTDAAAPVPGAPILKNCNMCSKLEPAQFHMVMSDSTLRSFCSYGCAARYKGTFGFQVSGGIHTVNKEENDASTNVEKDSQTCETQTNMLSVGTQGTKMTSKLDLKDAKTLMRMFCPPHLSNKSTSCRPQQNTKGVQCKPHQWHKSTQTDDECRAIIPVPIPVYVPTPMMMYNAPTPVPLIIPVPVPIPVFIPTLEKTTKELEDKIKSILEKYNVPEVAEMLELAKKEEKKTLKRKFNEDEETKEGEGENAGADSIESELEVISKMETSLPKYKLDDIKENDAQKRKSDPEENTSAKRRKVDDEDEEEEEEEETEYLDLLLGLSVWHAWTQRKSVEEDEISLLLEEDLSNMSSEVLSQCLILFLNELSAQDSQFDADTIFYILLGLQKYLFEKGSTHCIFLEVNFDKFTSTFDEMVQKFFQVAAHPETKFLEGTRVTEEMLWEARQLGAHTPHVLINTLFYFNTKIFKLKRASDHLSICFNLITKEGKRSSPNGKDGTTPLTMYLKYSQQSKSDDTVVRPLMMYENKENPLRCPVKLYEFYLSKCPASILTREDTYYVYPERTCLPDSSVWYSSDHLEVHTIDKMLNRILLVREVQEALAQK